MTVHNFRPQPAPPAPGQGGPRECGKLVDIHLADLTQALQAQVDVPILCYDLKLMYVCEACRKKMADARPMLQE